MLVHVSGNLTLVVRIHTNIQQFRLDESRGIAYNECSLSPAYILATVEPTELS